MFHLPLAARAVAGICPELAPRIPAAAPPQADARLAAFPELAALRVLATSHHGCHLAVPLGGPTRPVEDLDRVLAEHPLLLFNDAVFSFTPDVLRRFDRIIFVQRDIRDQMAANALAQFHLLNPSAGQEERDAFCRTHGNVAARFWNFQTLGFSTLAERLPVHVLDFAALAADRVGELRRLADFLDRPLPPSAGLGGLLDNTLLPPEFAEPGLGERILPPDVLAAMNRYCTGPERAPAPDAPLPWEFRNTLHAIRGRGHAGHVVVHIPARSGSTRLPGKNVADLGGKPLMAWTILLACRLPGVHRVIVNTNDPDYAAIAREYGAETPFLRPGSISGDLANLGDATDYLSDYLVHREGYDIAKLVTLYPTSPFRTVAEVARLIGLMDRYPMVQTCVPARPDWDALYRDGADDPLARSLLGSPARRYPFKYTGAFLGRSFVASGQGILLAPHRSPVECVDIDEQEDLDLARLILASGLHHFGAGLC